jgi:hypothetical protein
MLRVGHVNASDQFASAANLVLPDRDGEPMLDYEVPETAFQSAFRGNISPPSHGEQSVEELRSPIPLPFEAVLSPTKTRHGRETSAQGVIQSGVQLVACRDGTEIEQRPGR